MKIGEIINYNEIINVIINELNNVDSLAKFKLLGLCKQFESIIGQYEIARDELVNKYGENRDGKFGIFEPIKDDYPSDEEYNIAVEKHDSFKKELRNILDTETNIKIKKIKYTTIINAGIPANYLVAIYNLIEEWLGGIE